MKTNVTSFLLLLVLIINCSPSPDAHQAEGTTTYSLEQVVSDNVIPWGMAWLPSGDMLYTDKTGNLKIVRDGELQDEPIAGLPEITVRGQGGLLDVAVHPNFEENGWIYLSYASSEGDGEGANTAIMRAKLEGNALTEQEVLYKGTPNSRRGQHFGSRLEFDNNGYLFFSIGDRGNRDVNPQDLTRDGGKIYRIHDDGRIPDDNPFVNQDGAKKAVYSYGHRNPQGMTLNKETGQIWAHEHGPQGGDEINVIEPGKNYGWPVISYGINYNGTTFAEATSREGMEQPIKYWVPSIAPSGLAFVSSDKYPDWKGDVLTGSLKFGYLVRSYVEGNTVTGQEILFEDAGRIRNVEEAPDGYIYLGIESKGIFRIVPSE